MMVSVNDQVHVFLYSIAGGMAIAFLYDIFRIFRKAVRPGRVAIYFHDFLYWLIAAGVMLLTVYRSNDGELRGFLFIGAFLGIVLYLLLLSKIVMSSVLFIIKIVVRVIKTVIFIISYPIRLTVRVLAVPGRKLAGAASRTIRKAGARGKVRLTKLKFLRKGLKNIRKKI